jgi:5-methylcytosine-specific restriction endonuclease McrA
MTSENRRKKKNQRASMRVMLRRRYGSITLGHEALLQKTNGKCWICKEPIKGKITVDHIKQLADGGDNHWDNLMPACNVCNQKRGESLQ